MPEFKIDFWSNEFDDFIEFETIFQFYKARIKSLMCFPLQEQEKKRDGYCAGLIINILDTPQCEAYLKDKQVFTLHLEKICCRMLKDAPAFSDLHKEAFGTFKDAGIAGEILHGIWMLKDSWPKEHVGVAKAKYFLSLLPAGRELSERTIETLWQQYKCVAHLHGARRIQPRTRTTRQLDLDFLQPDHIIDFLEHGKKLEDFATTLIPKQGQQVPLISKDEIWSVKTNFPLSPPKVNIPQPHSEVKKLKRQYKSRNDL